MIAMRELKFPILNVSRAASIQYSITRIRDFFFGICKVEYILWNNNFYKIEEAYRGESPSVQVGSKFGPLYVTS
jgi:hypothetical protein